MKTFIKLIAPLLLLAGAHAAAQPAMPDFSKAFEAGKVRRAQVFEIMPARPGCIEFAGGSIMEDCEWKELLADDRIINRGIDGDTVEGLKARLPELLRHDPSAVFLEIGSSELGTLTAEEAVGGIGEIVSAFRKNDPSVEIYLFSSLPPSSGSDVTKEAVLDYNARLKGLCEQEGLVYIDLYSVFVSSDGYLPAEYGRSSVKLAPCAYALVGKTLTNYIQ